MSGREILRGLFWIGVWLWGFALAAVILLIWLAVLALAMVQLVPGVPA